jgi:hypothetical protein
MEYLLMQLAAPFLYLILKIYYKEIITACSSTKHKIVPLTNFNKYCYNGRREIKVNINNNSE